MLKKYSYYFNKDTLQPVKALITDTAQVGILSNERYDLISISESQYNEYREGLIAGKLYHYNGTEVLELPTPTRTPKWFEVVTYDTSTRLPKCEIIRKPLDDIKITVAKIRNKSINGTSQYNDRIVMALREMIDSGLPNLVYVEPSTNANRLITLDEAKALYNNICIYRQTQFIIEDAYTRAYTLGYAIPDPNIPNNWNLSVINDLMSKPPKAKRNSQ